MIEHISFEAGNLMLREIHRTLSPTGVARVATPDLGTVKRLWTGPTTIPRLRQQGNVGWERYHFAGSPCPSVPEDEIDNPVFAINRLFYGWRHRFIYDEPTLGRALERCGFHWVRSAVGQSVHTHLRGIEHRREVTTAEINEFETMVIEASKA